LNVSPCNPGFDFHFDLTQVRELIDRLVSTTSMSVRPAIYGMVAERELQRLARWVAQGAGEGSGGLVTHEHGGCGRGQG
jgi:hypothetical protein